MQITAVTTARSDWGALGMAATALRAAGHQVTVLAAAHHDGVEAIRADGFEPVPFDCWLTASSAIATLEARKPDWAIVLGDRWETVLVALACKYTGTRLAHLAGGDVTEGSADDAYRRAISMMATRHFPTNAPAADRLIAMGIDPQTVHMVGSAAIDRIRTTTLLSREELCAELGLSGGPFVLANWQPDGDNAGLRAIFDALDALKIEAIWATPGADPGQEVVTQIITERSGKPSRAMSPKVYLSAMRHCACMVGNSSSGIYEAPVFETPSVIVGDRQKGREAEINTAFVGTNSAAVLDCLRRTIDMGRCWQEVGSPYGDGHAAERIAEVMAHV